MTGTDLDTMGMDVSAGSQNGSSTSPKNTAVPALRAIWTGQRGAACLPQDKQMIGTRGRNVDEETREVGG